MDNITFLFRSIVLHFRRLGGSQRQLLSHNLKSARYLNEEQEQNLMILRRSSTHITIEDEDDSGPTETQIPVFRRKRSEVGETEIKTISEDLSESTYPNWDLRKDTLPVIQAVDPEYL